MISEGLGAHFNDNFTRERFFTDNTVDIYLLRGHPFNTCAVRGEGRGVTFCSFPYVRPYKKLRTGGGGVKNG